MVIHPIEPVYDENSKILILGSFPSVKSREEKFYYAHPQNRFWKVISHIIDCATPTTIEDKIEMLHGNRIALWDVIYSCEITGSSDSSIKCVVPNDIFRILNNSQVELIILNGKTSEKYYKRYLKEKVTVPSICLPSTSPANAICSLDDLIEKWSVIADLLHKKADR